MIDKTREHLRNGAMLLAALAPWILLFVLSYHRAPHAQWSEKTQTWSCPDGGLIWASEDEAVKGSQDFVYCVKP